MKSPAGSKPSRITLSGELKQRREMADVEAAQAGKGERRAKPRLKEPFPTRAWGTDAAGQAFEIDGVLDNISSTGLYLRVPRQMKLGAEITVIIKFLHGRDGATALLRVQVLRDELQPDGRHGLALKIKEHHFL
jgi:hypothetical protein